MPADFSEVNNLAADLGKAGPRQVKQAQRVIVKTIYDVVGTGKQLAAVDTGLMRSTIGADIGVLSAIAGPTVSYGPHVEHGTSRMPPQPFMAPALERHERAFYAAMEQVVGGVFD